MKRFMIAAGLALLSTSPALAQPAKPVEVKEAEPAAPASMRNISLELTITDQTTAADSAKKVVSMIVGDRQRGSIRTSGSVITPVEGRTSVILNVDARPWIQANNTVILMTLTIEYSPKLDPANESEGLAADAAESVDVAAAGVGKTNGHLAGRRSPQQSESDGRGEGHDHEIVLPLRAKRSGGSLALRRRSGSSVPAARHCVTATSQP